MVGPIAASEDGGFAPTVCNCKDGFAAKVDSEDGGFGPTVFALQQRLRADCCGRRLRADCLFFATVASCRLLLPGLEPTIFALQRRLRADCCWRRLRADCLQRRRRADCCWRRPRADCLFLCNGGFVPTVVAGGLEPTVFALQRRLRADCCWRRLLADCFYFNGSSTPTVGDGGFAPTVLSVSHSGLWPTVLSRSLSTAALAPTVRFSLTRNDGSMPTVSVKMLAAWCKMLAEVITAAQNMLRFAVLSCAVCIGRGSWFLKVSRRSLACALAV